jgi:phosphoglycolate phosphatase
MELLTIPILKHIGWFSTLSTLVCGDTVSRSKPYPEPVLAACQALGIKPAEVLMVGDDPRDMEAGIRAGCSTAFALYGYADLERHSEIGDSTELIKAPAEVLYLLDSPGAG